MIPLTLEQIESVLAWMEFNNIDEEVMSRFIDYYSILLFSYEPDISYFKN